MKEDSSTENCSGHGMSQETNSFIYRLLNICFAFGMLCLFSSYLPHWPDISFHAWINECLFFSTFLVSTSILLKDKNNKDIFINLSVLLLFNSFSYVNIFLGDDFLLGSNKTAWVLFAYKKIILCNLWIFNIAYLCVKYVLLDKSMLFRYLITSIFIIPVMLFNFYPYFITKGYLSTLGSDYLPDLNQRIFLSYLLPFLLILFYGYQLYKKDKSLGRYINSLMAVFFIIVITSIINSLAVIFNFRVLSLMQYIITFNLFCLFAILMKKLLFLRTDYGQFYESVISRKGKIGKVRIQHHNATPNSILIQFLMNYLYHRRNYLLLLLFLTCTGVFFFQFPRYFTFNIAAFIICLMIIVGFLHALYKRRAKSKFIIS